MGKPKSKRQSAIANRKKQKRPVDENDKQTASLNTQEKEGQHAAQEHAAESAAEDEDDVVMELEDPMALSDDEPPAKQLRRHRRPKLDSWAIVVIEDLIEQHGEEIMREVFHSESPAFDVLERHLNDANKRIQSANREHSVSMDRNIIPVSVYRTTYTSWQAYIDLEEVSTDAGKGWKAYHDMYKVIRLTNRDYHLPDDWNFSPEDTQALFGDRPEGIEYHSDADSAVDYSEESESEESDADDLEGIDALESRMRKEYSSLSTGKVLYWWPVGMGAQVFVRYGPKRKAIYRVRAGSSEVYDKRTTELVLSQTRGTAKVQLEENGVLQEVWKFSRNDVLDILGVGWKVEDDDEAGINALALIRPQKDAIYPHTRALVKWKDGQVSLERRGFIRRIASGNSFNGDRMLYMKAKELENAYWGYDVEEDTDRAADGNSQSLNVAALRSGRQQRGQRHQKIPNHVRFVESEGDESDADSEVSRSSLSSNPTPPRSRRRAEAKRSKGRDIDSEIDRLMEELSRLKLKKRSSHGKKSRTRQSMRW